jgi:PEP-CTERM motif
LFAGSPGGGGTLLASAVAAGATDGALTLAGVGTGSGNLFLQYSAFLPVSINDYSQAEIDNINIDAVAVPEPGTMALVGLGLTTLLARRRRMV